MLRSPAQGVLIIGVCAVLLVPVAYLTSGFWAPAYNRYVFPLGRLSGRVHVGDSCGDVHTKFAAYYARYRNDGEISFNESVATTTILLTESVPSGRRLHLYHVNVFDDVQLTVRCDTSDRVAEMLFIGD